VNYEESSASSSVMFMNMNIVDLLQTNYCTSGTQLGPGKLAASKLRIAHVHFIEY
jgi:hypothetical protein